MVGNYKFSPYFYQTVNAGTRQFYFAKGATTGVPGFFISYPVIERNRILGVMVIKLDLRS